MVNVAILGFGKIGSGTFEFLQNNAEIIERKTGERFCVKHILDIRDFSGTPYADKVTNDIDKIISDPEVTIVAEMMGGSHPAYEYTMKALSAGKHVVSSNKEVVANFGDELLRVAEENGVRYLFEASVGGGIPIIRPMTNDLSGNDITEINGILNGTTNYILTQMFDYKKSFEDALAEAQAKGYAELDPTDDVMGKDACRKISILSALAYGISIHPDNVYTEGITKINADNVRHAAMMGASIKLIGHAEKNEDGSVFLMVSPLVVNGASPLAHVSDVFNGIMVHGEPLGDVFFYGRGAGKEPTASAVVADIIDIVVHDGENLKATRWEKAPAEKIASIKDFRVSAYLYLDGVCCEKKVSDIFGEITLIELADGKAAIVTAKMPEAELDAKIEQAKTAGITTLSKIRVL